ncbi:MAG: hypothetical protein K6A67_01050, partial [Bacteroidales bacterium]|nr:hypothetical protein [Bacteroidales bacterium]
FQDFGLLSASFCLSFSHDAPHHSFIQYRNLLKSSLELFGKQFLEVANYHFTNHYSPIIIR